MSVGSACISVVFRSSSWDSWFVHSCSISLLVPEMVTKHGPYVSEFGLPGILFECGPFWPCVLVGLGNPIATQGAP